MLSAKLACQQFDQAIRPVSGRLLIAYSGGADSRFLLNIALQQAPQRVVLCHFNHAWSEHGAEWQHLAQTIAKRHGIAFLTATDPNPSQTEDEARRARYAWFESLLQPGDAVLLGHHARDQIETRWMRSTQDRPPRGMPASRPLGQGMLIRPFLQLPPVPDPEAIQDPTNDDPRYRRAAVRRLLKQPDVQGERQLLERFGTLFDRLESKLVQAIPEGNLEIGQIPNGQLVSAMAAWVWRISALPAPPRRRLESLASQLPARPDRHPAIQWDVDGIRFALRAYRDKIFLEPAVWTAPPPQSGWRPIGAGESKKLHDLGIPPWHRPWVWCDASGGEKLRWWQPIVRHSGQISLEYIDLND